MKLVSRIVLKGIGLSVLVYLVGYVIPTVKADVVVLTNGNSTVTVDLGSQAGVSDWAIDGVHALQKQWFWYRIGPTGGEHSIDTAGPVAYGLSDVDFDGLNDTLVFQYVNSDPSTPFTISAHIQLTGGQPGDGSSGISEVISILNTGANPLDFHFYQYNDFNLDPANPASDTVTYPSANEMVQNNPNGASSDCGALPIPTHHQADLVSNNPTNVLTLLNDSSPTTLNDQDGPKTGDAAWGNEWDVIIQPGNVFQLSANKKVSVAKPTGPGQICVHKFYDANADGIDNDGQVVVDWRFNLTGTDGKGNCISQKGYTDDNGNVCFTNLPAGNYTVCEVFPSHNSWVATTATSVRTNLSMGQTISLSFGNICMGDGQCVPVSTWCQWFGQSNLTSNDFAALTALCLRNSDGSDRDFTSSSLSANKSAYNSWVYGQSSANMAYSLSVELATMVLSIRQGSITNSATQLVYAPGCGNAGMNNNFITVDDLVSEASAALCADGLTKYGDSNRAYQQALNSALDKANNNQNFVSSDPCDTFTESHHFKLCDRHDGRHDYDDKGNKCRHHDDPCYTICSGWGW
ncbi:MAG TPA: hypothetical protein VL171_00340 [Verrucomicrobiae bacterium]|nr:hypothetical protein [Verrucomicrobiae bacterium]